MLKKDISHLNREQALDSSKEASLVKSDDEEETQTPEAETENIDTVPAQSVENRLVPNELPEINVAEAPTGRSILKKRIRYLVSLVMVRMLNGSMLK